MVAALRLRAIAILATVIPYTGPTQPMPTCAPEVREAFRLRWHGAIDCADNVKPGALPYAPTAITAPTPTPGPTPAPGNPARLNG